MDNQEIPQSREVVNHQAKELFQEHLSIAALKENAKEKLSSVEEDREAATYEYDNLIDKNHAQLAIAAKFAKENLPQLKDQAMQEAILAGKTIVEQEEFVQKEATVEVGQHLNAHRGREILEEIRQKGGIINPILEANQKIIEDYCEANGIDASKIPPDVMLKIKTLPQWQDPKD